MAEMFTVKDETGDRLEVSPSAFGVRTALVHLTEAKTGDDVAVYVSKEQAPELAAAILRAAGSDDVITAP